jgi:predicted ATPase
VQVRDLGEHRLKDLGRGQRLFQLRVEGLRDEFPPLNTLENRPSNLPVQPTALVGRELELREIGELLGQPDVRLLTLTGTGGVGKTRLALQAAAELIDEFPGGVFFVSLAPLDDARLVVGTVTQALGLREQAGESPITTLSGYLAEREVLLVLDNFERLLGAAPDVSRLLAEASRLRIIVTSRERLRLAAEHVYAVSTFALPLLESDPGELLGNDAVALFVERARAAGADWSLGLDNAATVAAICDRLEGLPLAIELAASGVAELSPDALLRRLDRRLALLTSGARDAPARHQTLSDTIGWSYDLLDPAEKKFFAQLAVFVDGCRAEAAEAVCRPDRADRRDALDKLSALVEKALLRRRDDPDGEPRFWMLDTIREFADARLESSPRAERHCDQRHRRYYLAVATESEPKLRGPEQAEHLACLYAELPNIRAALNNALAHDAESALTAATSLAPFWIGRGLFSEGREWLNQSLRRRKERRKPEARALVVAAELACEQNDYAGASRLVAQSKSIASGEVGDSVLGRALVVEGWIALWRDDLALVAETARSAIEKLEPLGPSKALSESWALLAWSEAPLGRWDESQADLEMAHEIAVQSGDTTAEAERLGDLAICCRSMSNLEAARTYGERAIALARTLGNRHIEGQALADLAHVTCDEGDGQTALEFAEDAAGIAEDLAVSIARMWALVAKARALRLVDRDEAALELLTVLLGQYEESQAGKSYMAPIAEELASIADASGNAAHAAALWGAAARVRHSLGMEPTPNETARLSKEVKSAREQLGDESFTSAWEVGYGTDPEDFARFATSSGSDLALSQVRTRSPMPAHENRPHSRHPKGPPHCRPH